MKASYLLAFALFGGALIAGLLLWNAPRRSTATASDPAPGSLGHAVSMLTEDPGDLAVRPIRDPGVARTGATGPASPDARRDDPRAGRAKSPDRAAPAEAPAPGQGGMIVVLDPESGEFVAPTAEQARALMGTASEATSRSGVGLIEKIGVGGAVGVDLQGRFQDYATITIGPDGKKHFGCLHGGPHTSVCLDSLPAPRALEVE